MARLNTSTQIRTIYSDGISYMTMKFFNTSFSFQFVPYKGKNAAGRPEYDKTLSQQTTVNYNGAFALYKCAKDITDGTITTACSITIPCASDAKLTLECRDSQTTNQLDTFIIIEKNNTKIEFKFDVQMLTIQVNNQPQQKPIYTGLGVLQMVLDGYLTGINADRHLDKMTEDFAKSQEEKKSFSNNNQPYQKKQWNNNYQAPEKKQSWETSSPNQENASTYKLPV